MVTVDDNWMEGGPGGGGGGGGGQGIDGGSGGSVGTEAVIRGGGGEEVMVWIW